MKQLQERHVGIVRIEKGCIYAVCHGIFVSTLVRDANGHYGFVRIAQPYRDHYVDLPSAKSAELAVDLLLTEGFTVLEFSSIGEFHAWLGQRYAATTPPAAEPKEKKVSAHSLHILEDKIASMDRIFGRKLEELAMMVGKLQADENRHTQPSENRDGQNREDGFYIVNRPPLPIPFVAQSINGKWYIPGEKLHYGGYLRVHSKMDMSE